MRLLWYFTVQGMYVCRKYPLIFCDLLFYIVFAILILTWRWMLLYKEVEFIDAFYVAYPWYITMTS